MSTRATESKATLHDVAARAGVSIATVSRALNGLPVSAKSMERVQKAAQEVGYVANLAARALRSERSHTMGLVFFDLHSTMGVELLDALSETIEDAGYSLLVSTARGDTRRFDRLLRRLLERRVDALFCVQARGQSEILARYHAAAIPVVAAITGAGAFAEMPLVSPSIGEAADTLALRLRELGHGVVGLVQRGASSTFLARIGRALAAHDIRVEPLACQDGGNMGELVRGAMARPDAPTALIALSTDAQALLAASDARGMRVPDEVSIVGVGTGSGGLAGEGVLSHLLVDPHRLGRAVGMAMLSWLAGAAPAKRVAVEIGTWVPRATTGRAPVA